MDEKITIAAHADYAREHFIFQRTESPFMRNLPWHSRARPAFINVNWGLIGAVAVCAVVFAIVMVRIQ